MFKPDLGDISAELEAVAALLMIVSDPFCQGEVTASNQTVGAALFGLQMYVDRINVDVMRIEEEGWKAKAG